MYGPDDDDVTPVKGFGKKKADGGALPGHVAMVGCPSTGEPEKGNK